MLNVLAGNIVWIKRRNIGILHIPKDDDREDACLWKRVFKDKKKKGHLHLWIFRLFLILIVGLLATTLIIPFLRRINFWEVNL
jgi:hypothetical protein